MGLHETYDDDIIRLAARMGVEITARQVNVGDYTGVDKGPALGAARGAFPGGQRTGLCACRPGAGRCGDSKPCGQSSGCLRCPCARRASPRNSISPSTGGQSRPAGVGRGSSRHFARYGIAEGRARRAPAAREALIKIVSRSPSVLEIGPSATPFSGPGRRLLRRSRQGRPAERAATIGQVRRRAATSTTSRHRATSRSFPAGFSAVVSSHCIEHQPDLIRHLQQVAARCSTREATISWWCPTGSTASTTSSPNSTLAQELSRPTSRVARVHRLASAIEHRALTTHNAVKRHWAGDHLDPGYHPDHPSADEGRRSQNTRRPAAATSTSMPGSLPRELPRHHGDASRWRLQSAQAPSGL